MDRVWDPGRDGEDNCSSRSAFAPRDIASLSCRLHRWSLRAMFFGLHNVLEDGTTTNCADAASVTVVWEGLDGI